MRIIKILLFSTLCFVIASSLTFALEIGPAPTNDSLDKDGPFAVKSFVVTKDQVTGFDGGTVYYPTDPSYKYGIIAVSPGLGPIKSILFSGWGYDCHDEPSGNTEMAGGYSIKTVCKSYRAFPIRFTGTRLDMESFAKRLASFGFVTILIEPVNKDCTFFRDISFETERRANQLLNALQYFSSISGKKGYECNYTSNEKYTKKSYLDECVCQAGNPFQNMECYKQTEIKDISSIFINSIKENNIEKKIFFKDIIDINRLAVAGYKKGGAGALMAAARDNPSLKAVIIHNINSNYLYHIDMNKVSSIKVPQLIFSSPDNLYPEFISCGWKSDGFPDVDYFKDPPEFYNQLPSTTPKVYVKTNFPWDKAVGESPYGPIDKLSVAWAKFFVDGDARYKQFLCGQTAEAYRQKETTYKIIEYESNCADCCSECCMNSSNKSCPN